MNTKFLVVMMLSLGFCACGVTLKDKIEPDESLTELIVDGDYSLPPQMNMLYQRVIQYDRLVLRKGARFITEGANVRLEIKELIAEDAAISTFGETAAAAPRRSGRAGGHLDLRVEKASGKLVVELRGEKGGDGAAGANSDQSLKGVQGHEGGDYAIYSTGSTGATHVFPGTEGQPGGAGAAGFRGEDGFPGGSSGTGYIQIADDSHLLLVISKLPGAGGLPGQGGDGGEGGDGGRGGLRFGYQNRYANGPKGPQGPQGSSGNVGSPGVAEHYCVQRNSGASQCQ